MEDQKILGNRIRSFRKRAGLSQMDLEIEIEASPGSLSRIENGEVNPTKETLKKIEKILKLDRIEIDFLLNKFPSEVTSQEIAEARKEVAYILDSEQSFAYLADERFRAWDLSKGFQNLWKLSDNELDSIKGSNLLEDVFDPKMPIYNLLQTDEYDKTATMMIARYKAEVPYWNVDEYSLELINRLMKLPKFSEVWNFLENKNLTEYIYNHDSRKIKFNINGIILEANYAREFLKSNPRFIIVTYVPNKSMLNLIKNNIKEKLWIRKY